MPYTTVSTGSTISASWANTNVRDQVVTPFATTAARDSAITSPVSGMVAPITGDQIITYYNGSVWVCITPQSAAVATSQTTTSTSYTDLSTAGPAVTLVTGTSALVTINSRMQHSTSGVVYAAVAVSGATTVAAADTASTFVTSSSAFMSSRTFKMTGLTAGSNTFTMKYKIVVAGTGTFSDRDITVVGLP